MGAPLLQTKLYIPPVRAELVPRPRLIGRLNAGLRQNGFGEGGPGKPAGFARKLTLISAPAGFGKTTLLSEWASHLGSPTADRALEPESTPAVRDVQSTTRSQVAWLSLDEDDNDPVRFLTYICAALQKVEGHFDEGALDALQSPQPPPRESLLTALINRINAVPHDFVLVLDDYHVITGQSIHKGLEFLLEHLPANMHLVIATRSDPPLHLARLRGRGHLNELRQSDLSFTSDEAAQFLNQVMGLDLTVDEVVALASRTEGWVVGLQMAAIAISGQGAAAVSNQWSVTSGQKMPLATTQFIQAFTGSNRYILDYLVEEVLNRQEKGTQDFLLRTSILERLCGPLCDAVCSAGADVTFQGNGSGSGQPAEPTLEELTANGQAILEQLEHANLFIVPLDNERHWYRYHRLFADLLRQRLQQVYPESAPVLHRRASEWYERNGLVPLAIDHAVSAGDFERAAHLVEQTAEATLARGEFATCLRWLDSFPDKELRARPRLCAYHATVLLFMGRPLHEIKSRLQDAEEGDTTGAFAGELALLRAVLAMLEGGLQTSIELSHRALELLPEENLFFRGLVARNLAAVHKLTGDVTAAIRALDDAESTSQQASDLVGTMAALQLKAEMRIMQGRLHEAKALYERALGLVVDRKGRLLPVAVKVLVGLGDLLRQWNDLDAAMGRIMEAIELAKGWSETWGLGGYIALARIRQAQGDTDGALEAVQTAERFAVEFDASDIDDITVAAFQARLWVAQGNLEAASRWVAERGFGTDAGPDESAEGTHSAALPYYLREIELTTLARVYLGQARPDEALAVLKPLLQAAERLGRTGSVIEILALQALALHAQRDMARAMTCLKRALSLAEPEGYARIFIDEGESMERLLYEAAARGIAPEYTGKLLVAFDSGPKDPSARRTTGQHPSSSGIGHSSLIEPLSEREVEVLQLFSEGLTNREVAQGLYISLHTVKWHAGNIYGKLGVKNRVKAVAKARALGLLPNP